MKFTVPRYCLLDGFTMLSAATAGVDLHGLSRDDAIRLHTLNSEYRIVLLDPFTLQVSVQGGALFKEPTEAVVRGSSYGGALLKVGWIGIGLQLELAYRSTRDQVESLVTSPIERLCLERAWL